ncbi:hypothetical protein V6Z11_A07G165600 [Gossypium hirsutum]
MDVGNDYYLVRFQNKDDYETILTQEPWIVFGHYFKVQSWTVDFNLSKPFPEHESGLDLFSGIAWILV